MEKLPQLRPAWVDRAALQRAQWVRALLGRPALLLLDQPGQHVSAAALSPLADAVQEAMDRGATVVWFTLDDGVWNNAPVRMKYRRMMQGERLVDDVET
jgi:phospholipid/cholesterol/gamma-HCH transport system ATP-binding protein